MIQAIPPQREREFFKAVSAETGEALSQQPAPAGQLTSAFTLVEMLVVIAIIGILAALLMPAIGEAQRRAREEAIRTEIQSLDLAMTQYYQDWGRYPPDMHDSGNIDSSGEALVYYLGTKFRVNANDPDEVSATKNGGPYFNFKPSRLTDYDGDGFPVYVDYFLPGSRDRGNVDYYRFDNNDDDGGDESNWHEDYEDAHNGWNVANVHPSKVDIWSAGEDGEDKVGQEHPTQSDLKPTELGDDIGNW